MLARRRTKTELRTLLLAVLVAAPRCIVLVSVGTVFLSKSVHVSVPNHTTAV